MMSGKNLDLKQLNYPPFTSHLACGFMRHVQKGAPPYLQTSTGAHMYGVYINSHM